MDPYSLGPELYRALFAALLLLLPARLGVECGVEDPLLWVQFPGAAAVPQAPWVDVLNDPWWEVQQFLVGDVSSRADGWAYAPGDPSQGVWRSYRAWVDAVLPAGPAADPEYQRALAAEVKAAAAMQAAVRDAAPAWEAWRAQNPDSPYAGAQAWLGRLPPFAAAQPYAARYQGALAQYAAATDAQARIEAGADALLRRARAAAADTAYQRAYTWLAPGPLPLTWTAGITRVGDALADPVVDYATWQAGETAGQNPAELLLYASGTGWRALPPAPPPPPPADTAERLVARFRSLNVYPVSRPGWFDLAALRAYAARPTADGVDRFAPGTGPLRLVTASVVLGWIPTLELTLRDTAFQAARAGLEAGSGVMVGGVVVGAGAAWSVRAGPVPGMVVVAFADSAQASGDDALPRVLAYVEFRTVPGTPPAMGASLCPSAAHAGSRLPTPPSSRAPAILRGRRTVG